jgi:sugar O-acyltransferase (sialic acid O-acetyltransferase NeuD family)
MKSLLLIGTGGHAKSCINLIEGSNKFFIKGLISEKKADVGKMIINKKIIGTDKDLFFLKKKIIYAGIGIGQVQNWKIRLKFFILLKNFGYKIPAIISKFSTVAKSSEVDEGTYIFDKVVVNSNVKIGKNCIINTGSVIEHDVRIGNNSHISTGAIINGETEVGNNTFIGSGAIIKNGISIGNNCVIGIGKVIKSSIKDNTFFK